MSAYPHLKVMLEECVEEVLDLGNFGSCFGMALADMVTCTYKMKRQMKVRLSPQSLKDCPVALDMKLKHLKDPGLFNLEHCPFLGFPRPTHEALSLEGFEISYPLDDTLFIEEEKDVERALLFNFTPKGWGVPLVGQLFIDDEYHKLGRENKVYSPTEEKVKEYGIEKAGAIGNHSLLIVGINTTGKNKKDHYCVVKDTTGIRIREDGLFKVSLNGFESVIVPILDHPDFKSEFDKFQI